MPYPFPVPALRCWRGLDRRLRSFRRRWNSQGTCLLPVRCLVLLKCPFLHEWLLWIPVRFYAAQPVTLFIDRRLNAQPCQIICRCHTGRPAADDRCLFAAVCLRCNRCKHMVKRLCRTEQLRIADLHRRLIKVACAVALAPVGTDRTGNKRQCVPI